MKNLIFLLLLLVACSSNSNNKFYYIGCAQYGFTTQKVIENCGSPSDYIFNKDKEIYYYYMPGCIEVAFKKKKVEKVSKCS